jgi:hypothetical protein
MRSSTDRRGALGFWKAPDEVLPGGYGVLFQGSGEQTQMPMQRKAQVDNLLQVFQIRRRLQAGGTLVSSSAARKSTNYTYPGFSNYFKFRKLLKKLQLERLRSTDAATSRFEATAREM